MFITNFNDSTWILFGLLNLIIIKSYLLYYGYYKKIDLSVWVLLVLFATLGGGIGSIFYHSIIGVMIGFIAFFELGKILLQVKIETDYVITFYFVIMLLIGRIGCLLSGCCFGSLTSVPWSISYPSGTLPYRLHFLTDKIDATHSHSLSIHPIQIYEILFLLIFIFIAYIHLSASKKRCNILYIFVPSYMVFRFLIEFIRDINHVWWGSLNIFGLSYFQISLIVCLVLFSIIFLVKNSLLDKMSSSNIPTNNLYKIILFTFFLAILFKNMFHPIYLFQFIILIPLSMLLIIKRNFANYSFFQKKELFVLSSSLISLMILSNTLRANIFEKEKGIINKPYSIYIVDNASKNFIRLGDTNMSFSEFDFRYKKLGKPMVFLNNISNSTSEDLNNNKSSTTEYYHIINPGYYKYRVGEGCSGKYLIANHKNFDYTFKVINENKDLVTKFPQGLRFKSERGASVSFVHSTVHFDEYESGPLDKNDSLVLSGTTRQNTIHLYAYAHRDFSIIGLGAGLYAGVPNLGGMFNNHWDYSSSLIISPTLYMRIGPEHLSIEASLGYDKYSTNNFFGLYKRMGFNSNNFRFGLQTLMPGFYYFSFPQLNISNQFSIEPTIYYGHGYSLDCRFYFLAN